MQSGSFLKLRLTKDQFQQTCKNVGHELAALKTVDEITLTVVKKQLCESGMFEGISIIRRTDHDEDSFTQMRLQFIQALVDNFKSGFPEQQGRRAAQLARGCRQWFNCAGTRGRRNAVPVVFWKPERRTGTSRQDHGGIRSGMKADQLSAVFPTATDLC